MTSRKPSLPVPVVRVDRDALAKALSLTPQRVSQLAKERVLTKHARGDYDLHKSCLGYIRFLQAAMGSKATMHDDGALTTTRAQRSELLAVELEMRRSELAQRRSESMAVSDHRDRMVAMIVETKAQIMAIAPNAAPKVELAVGRAAIEHVIKAECLRACDRLADSMPLPVGPRMPTAQIAKAKQSAKKKPRAAAAAP